MNPYLDAIQRYDGYRTAVLDLSQRAFLNRVHRDPALSHLENAGVRFGPIDDDALANVAPDWAPQEFPWSDLKESFLPYPNRFELALSADGIVYAMAYGRPSDGPDNVTIHFVERWTGERNPFKGLVVPIMTDVATTYAKLLHKGRVKVKNPYAEAVQTYMNAGYTPTDSIGRNTYMERRVP